MKTKIHLQSVFILCLLVAVSCDKESAFENFQRISFVKHDYNTVIDTVAEKFLPSGDIFSVLTYSDSTLNFEYDIDYNNQSIHRKEVILPSGLIWVQSTINEEPVLRLDSLNNIEMQIFANSIKPAVEEKDEYPVFKDIDSVGYYLNPRKKLCLHSELPENFGRMNLNWFDGYSLIRFKNGRNISGFQGLELSVPYGKSTLKNSGVGIMAFRKSQIDSIAALQSGNPMQPYYLFQDESQSFEIVDNGKGYYSMVFYGNIDHQNKPAGWLQIGTEKFQLPRLNGNTSPAEGEVYECLFYETGQVGLYGFTIKTHQLYR